MKTTLITLLCLCGSLTGRGQQLFSGLYASEEPHATLYINLEEKNIPLKDLDFDETYGYVKGDVNGTWAILKVVKMANDGRKATVRMVSDIGVDAQNVELSIKSDSVMEMRLVDEQNMKAVKAGKYVKMPKTVIFKKND